jgi:predicted DCC family thiol-disulfide oxidoreductase YuxK
MPIAAELLQGVWLVYDGECPLCQSTAKFFRLKEAKGTLHLLDARSDPNHPILHQIKQRGLNLDEGFVIVDDGVYYHGKSALRYLSDIGKDRHWFTHAIGLFRSEFMANVFYPLMRGTRNFLLRIRSVPKIDNLINPNEPIFQRIFGQDWHSLPTVMKRHYANRPLSGDCTQLKGSLDVRLSPLAKIISPLFRLTHTLVPYSGNDVAVTVQLISTPNNNRIVFHRVFYFPLKGDYEFRSLLIPQSDNSMIEITRSGIGWHCNYVWKNDRVILEHRGYILKVFGWHIPLPITWIIGKTHAHEVPINDDSFNMQMEIVHPIWGKFFGYSGKMTVAQDA